MLLFFQIEKLKTEGSLLQELAALEISWYNLCTSCLKTEQDWCVLKDFLNRMIALWSLISEIEIHQVSVIFHFFFNFLNSIFLTHSLCNEFVLIFNWDIFVLYYFVIQCFVWRKLCYKHTIRKHCYEIKGRYLYRCTFFFSLTYKFLNFSI